jgi:quinol-cytochrome oxidoreductase complex cytochrome b subunit
MSEKKTPTYKGPGAEALPVLPYQPDPDLPARREELPVGIDHPTYLVLVTLALFPILLGPGGHHMAEDMPDDETHPFFPDHLWPYPIIAVIQIITIGLMAALLRQNFLLEQSADPRIAVIPRPDWYFLFLFQFLKMGPEWLTVLVVPPAILTTLLVWPFIDQIAGPRLARRLGWRKWPVPGHNVYTAVLWCLFLTWILGFMFFAMAGPLFCLPWIGGRVCGA